MSTTIGALRWRVLHEGRIWPAGAPTVFPMRRVLERRWVVLLAAAVIFATVFGLRQADGDPRDAVAVLYVIPIVLASLELGVTGAVVTSALALGLVGLSSLTGRGDFDVSSDFSYVLAYLAVGVPAGRFADRMRDAQARHQLLLKSGLALAQLDPDGDLAGTLTAQAARVVPKSAPVAYLDDAQVPEIRPTDADVESFAIQARSVRYGVLEVSARRPLGPDDRATLAILALQAAVAAENQRLLGSERERAALNAELQIARLHLTERSEQLRELIARQETERGVVADELHEDVAQVLGAVLLGLASLERDLLSEDGRHTWQDVRADIRATLQALRCLAVSLRPPILRLGLKAALEDLADQARARGFGTVTISVNDAEDLTPQTQTIAYRVVEEAIAAVGIARQLSVRTEEQLLTLELSNPQNQICEDRLTVLKARVELSDGTLSTTATTLKAVVPLSEQPDCGPLLPRTPHSS